MTSRDQSLAVVLTVLSAGLAVGQTPSPLPADAAYLRERGVKTDAASLIELLRLQSRATPDARALDALIGSLGDASFAKREWATRQLMYAGPSALERLRAVGARDLEARRRAERCIAAIEGPPDFAAGYYTVCRLLRDPPPGLADALFAYLPVADAETVEAIWYGLDAAARAGAVAPAARAALDDKEPRRRALAAYLLGRYGPEADRAGVRQRLDDIDAEVRLRAAQGLLGDNDRAAVPALIDLLRTAPLDVAWQAEELLRWVAGDRAPADLLGPATRKRRRWCQRAWRHWWDDNGQRLDWVALYQKPRRPGLVLAGGTHGVSLSGCDGAARWHLAGASDVLDVHGRTARVGLRRRPDGGRVRGLSAA